MNHLQNRIEELNPMASLPSIAIDRYITAQCPAIRCWAMLGMELGKYQPCLINPLADIGVRSRHVGRQRIHPLARISLHMTGSEPQTLEAGPSALSAREPPGCPQRLARCVAMWCDAQRRVVERCDAPRRAALPTMMSISPTRLIDQANMAGREATSRQRCCRRRQSLSIAPKKTRLQERDVTKPVTVGFGADDYDACAWVVDHRTCQKRDAIFRCRFCLHHLGLRP